ncbi:MAG: stage III sporulation protein AB [Bacillus thermozeamaize]|uniref:Stage III sporulation protein AB n=1 Tax=Bacillus thermozeamaize TaxID=230954 RepID=A0A1Y3PC99_9BACI|nr:MAG: stage III sporulation protein AB [Bacillus thermozeamaize]
MKWMGMILILFSATALGFYYSRRFAERPQQLRHLQAAFEMLETDVLYRLERLSDSFYRIGSTIPKPIGPLFHIAAEELDRSDGLPTEQCWERALRRIWPETSLKEKEQEVLLQFGHSLGNSDRESQVKHIRALLRHLQVEEELAREEQLKYEKMSRTLGFLGGLFVVILLF